MMPTNRSNDNHSPNHSNTTIRRTRLPHRNNPLTPKYFSNTHLAIMQKTHPRALKFVIRTRVSLGVLYVLAVALPWHSELRGFTSW